MVKKEISDYINENLKKGHKLEEIRKFMATYGWSEKDINEGILDASGAAEGKPPEPKKPEEEAPEKKGHKKIIVAVIVLIILILVFLYVATDILNYFNELFPETLLPFNMSFSFFGQ